MYLVVLVLGSYARQVHFDLDTVSFKDFLLAYPASLQDHRRPECASRQDHHLGSNPITLLRVNGVAKWPSWRGAYLQPHCLLAFKKDAHDRSVRDDPKVGGIPEVARLDEIHLRGVAPCAPIRDEFGLRMSVALAHFGSPENRLLVNIIRRFVPVRSQPWPVW